MVLGIDPGVNGGVARLVAEGHLFTVEPFRPRMTHQDLVDLLRQMVFGCRIAFVEKVGHMTGDGGLGSNTFGRVDGLIRGALLAFGLEIRDVTPQVWQSAMGCLSGGDKNVTKARAAALFPGVKMTHSIADALLIAEYGRRLLARPVDLRPLL